jgi:hypothetical protein
MKWLFGPALLALIALAGCKPKDPLVGTWTGTELGAPVTYTFSSDRTFDKTAVNQLLGSKVTVDVSGSYQFDGKVLTSTATKVGVTGMPDRLNQQVQDQFKQNLNKPATNTVTFKGGDEMSITTAAGVGTFHRKA